MTSVSIFSPRLGNFPDLEFGNKTILFRLFLLSSFGNNPFSFDFFDFFESKRNGSLEVENADGLK